MALSNANKKRFRTIGHNLKPVVIIAQKGITENIRTEIERALKQHELIKIKLVTARKEDMKNLGDSICTEFNAERIQCIGQVLLIYRAAKNPDPRLSNLKRELI